MLESILQPILQSILQPVLVGGDITPPAGLNLLITENDLFLLTEDGKFIEVEE